MNELIVKKKEELSKLKDDSRLSHEINMILNHQRNGTIATIAECFKGYENIKSLINPKRDYLVRIPAKILKQIDKGNYDFLKSKDGETLATIVDITKKRKKFVHNLKIDEIKNIDISYLNNLKSNIYNITAQQQHAELAQMLSNIQMSIDQVSRGQTTDRFALVYSGKEMIEQALSLPDSDPNKNYLIMNAISKINEGKNKIELSIMDIINSEISFSNNKLMQTIESFLKPSKYYQIETQYYTIHEGVKVYFEATRLLVLSYSLIQSEGAIEKVISSAKNFTFIASDKMRNISAFVQEGDSENTLWFEEPEKIVERITFISDNLNIEDFDFISIEFNGEELQKEIKNDEMSKM